MQKCDHNYSFRMNIVSNYIIGYVNMVVYTVLLAYLFMTKRISFQTTAEKRMTIQVSENPSIK